MTMNCKKCNTTIDYGVYCPECSLEILTEYLYTSMLNITPRDSLNRDICERHEYFCSYIPNNVGINLN